MKFKIRYSDQIVGIFSIIAIAALIVLIFALGATKKWFVKKNQYHTFFESGAGLFVGKELTYKGFTIGKIESITLEGDMVRAEYYILGDYAEYVRENSLVQLLTSPIGLGSTFVFHPGLSERLLPANSQIHRLDSMEGRHMIRQKLVRVQNSEDSLNVLTSKVSSILDNLNILLGQFNRALSGRGNGNLAEIVKSLNSSMKSLSGMLGSIDASMAQGDGPVPGLLGEEMSRDLESIMRNLSTVMKNANGLVADMDPQVQQALTSVNMALIEMQDVMAGVKNNPLIRGGVPDRSQENPTTVQTRPDDF